MNHLSATELARLIRSKAVSPVEVLAAHLDAIEHANPAINAIVTLATEQAMDAARAAEAAIIKGHAVGPLRGVPIGIKDITPTAGIRTTYGSPLYADHVPEEDAEVVKRLKSAGAIIVGKTNTPEFATGANTVNNVFGATRNPWDLRLTAGGSTGGGAAAVAACMLPLAEGTDVGCSLRVPAAYCGVIGLRPTAGVVPNSAEPQPWDVTTVHGPVARNATDAGLMLDAMAGVSASSPISFDPPWRGKLVQMCEETRDLRDSLSIGFVADIAGLGVDAEVERICRSAARGLSNAHASVTELARSDLAEGVDAYQVLRGEWMVAQYADRLDRAARVRPEPRRQHRVRLWRLTSRDLAVAERKRAEIWQRLRRFFERVRPAADADRAGTAVSGRAATIRPRSAAGSSATTRHGSRRPFIVSLVALPAASVPAGMTRARVCPLEFKSSARAARSRASSPARR